MNFPFDFLKGGCCDEQPCPPLRTHITAANHGEVQNLMSMAEMCFSHTHASRLHVNDLWLPGWVLDVMDEMDERFGPMKDHNFYIPGGDDATLQQQLG